MCYKLKLFPSLEKSKVIAKKDMIFFWCFYSKKHIKLSSFVQLRFIIYFISFSINVFLIGKTLCFTSWERHVICLLVHIGTRKEEDMGGATSHSNTVLPLTLPLRYSNCQVFVQHHISTVMFSYFSTLMFH
jgi:hypothetical protein